MAYEYELIGGVFMLPEKLFENKVKKYLESIGVYPFGTAIQNITTPIIGYSEKRWGGSQFTKSGLPDMHVVIQGKSIELELKAPNGKPSELQLKNLDFINQGNGYGFILVESDKTVIRLEKWISEKYPQYSYVKVIDFDTFKKICNSLK